MIVYNTFYFNPDEIKYHFIVGIYSPRRIATTHFPKCTTCQTLNLFKISFGLKKLVEVYPSRYGGK